MALRLTEEEPGKDALVVRVRGNIDLNTVDQWEDLMRRLIRRRVDSVVVDLAASGHVSARGLKMLLACAANQSLMNGSLHVVGARGATRRTAKMVGLWDMAREAASVRSALKHAEDHRQSQEAGTKMLQKARIHSRRMARQTGTI